MKKEGLKLIKSSNQKHSDELLVDTKKSTFEIGKMNICYQNIFNDLSELEKNYITLTPIVTNLTNTKFITD